MTTNGVTALVLTSPQNDFLSETAVAWGLGGRNVQENGTVDNIERLLHSAKAGGTPVFVSPHYYYPSDHRWQFGRTVTIEGAPNVEEARGLRDDRRRPHCRARRLRRCHRLVVPAPLRLRSLFRLQSGLQAVWKPVSCCSSRSGSVCAIP